MTAATELALLETQYQSWIEAGMPQSYSLNGRTFTRVSADFWVRRIDQLRAIVARESAGMFAAGQFRSPD